MAIQNVEELLQRLQDPDELDRIADQLADILPAPDANDPNKPFLPEGFQAPQVGGQTFQPTGQAPAPVAQQPGTSPSIDFAAALLGQGRQ